MFTGTGFKWRPDDAVEFTQSIERFPSKLGTAQTNSIPASLPGLVASGFQRFRLPPFCLHLRLGALMGTIPKKLAYQWKRLKQISSTPLRSVPPATARPFPPAPEAFPVIAAAAKEKF